MLSAKSKKAYEIDSKVTTNNIGEVVDFIMTRNPKLFKKMTVLGKRRNSARSCSNSKTRTLDLTSEVKSERLTTSM